MRLFLILLAAGCGGSAGDGGEPDASRPVADGAAADPADAADEADARPTSTDVIGPYTSNLRLAVSTDFAAGSCYPDAGIDAVIITLEVDRAEAGQTITFSGGEGGHGYFCPADQDQPCVLYEEGEVAFETFRDGIGAVGSFSLSDGEVKGVFDARWCVAD